MRLTWTSIFVLAGALLLGGCRRAPTEVDRDNRRAVDSILTAITMKNARLLEESAKRTKARHEEGHLNDDDYHHLEAVIVKARAGDWQGAETDGYAFRDRRPFVREGE